MKAQWFIVRSDGGRVFGHVFTTSKQRAIDCIVYKCEKSRTHYLIASETDMPSIIVDDKIICDPEFLPVNRKFENILEKDLYLRTLNLLYERTESLDQHELDTLCWEIVLASRSRWQSLKPKGVGFSEG